MAIWDALARTWSVPLATALGGMGRRTAQLGFDGPCVCAETATEWPNRGFKGVRANIGYATPQEDLEVVLSIREAVGPDMSIMVDCNQSLTSTDAIFR